MIEMPDRTGELARVINTLREAKVELCGTWAWGEGNGKAKAILIGKDHKQTEEHLKKVGVKYTVKEACLCEGNDQLGVFQEILQKVAKAGVNLHAANAVGTGGRFCTALWPEEGQEEKLFQLLGCK